MALRILVQVIVFLFLFIPIQLLGQSRSALNAQAANQSANASQSLLGNRIDADEISLALLRSTSPLEGQIAPETYVLGPQDVISVDVKGKANAFFPALVISPLGEITIPTIGTLALSGKTLTEARTVLQTTLSQQFTSPTVSVNLIAARKMVIHVSGDVPYPGRHHLDGLSRVDKALFSAMTDPALEGMAFVQGTIGSPFNISKLPINQLGLRNIELHRADGSKLNADLLSYLFAGKLDANPLLQSGDVILVRRITHETPHITISGAVTNPRELEFRNEDTISDLLIMAGALLVNADTEFVQVNRTKDTKVESIRVPASQFSSFSLVPNDRIVVPFKSQALQPATAWIIGEAAFPGSFPIIEGVTTVQDVISLAGGLTPQALKNGAYIQRSGSLQRGAQDSFYENKPEAELLKRTSDQYQQGFAYLDVESRVSANRVFVDLKNPDQLANIRLFNNDRIFIPRDEQTVLVFGQVNNSGYYPISLNLKAQNYIQNAGGFTIAADKKRVFVIKAGTRAWFDADKATIESGDMIFVDRIPYDDYNAKRMYDNAQGNLMNARISLILSAISTTVLVLSFISR